MKRDLLSIQDLSADEIHALLDLARTLKHDGARGPEQHALRDRAMALLFEKPSLRTRLSFELAMAQLGGRSWFMSPAEVGLGVRESVADVARTLSEYVDVIVGRVFEHHALVDLANAASIPVINGLSDREHPCQILADLLTLSEHFGGLAGRTIAYVGDGNNIAQSLIGVAPLVGVNLCVASPAGYEPSPELLRAVNLPGQSLDGWVEVCRDPAVAVRDADAIYADAWYRMGQEHQATIRREVFRGYQVNLDLIDQAPDHAVALHCLPAHRGDEITDEVLDGPRSLAFRQVANRVHVQKAVLLWLLRR